MRNYFLKSWCMIVLSFLATGSSYAQKMKVTYDDDMIRVNGEPYAMMKKTNKTLMNNDWSVKSLSGTELIYIKVMMRAPKNSNASNNYGATQEPYYEMNFLGSGAKAEFDNKGGNYFAKLIAEGSLIKDNAIDGEAEKRFILVNNGWLPAASQTPTVNVVVNNNTPAPVAEKAAPAAKSKEPVVIAGNEIRRGSALIGKFRQDTVYVAPAKKVHITIYNESGEKIGEAFAPIVNAAEWDIKTTDGKTYNIMYDSPNEREKMFKYLSDKNLLTN